MFKNLRKESLFLFLLRIIYCIVTYSAIIMLHVLSHQPLRVRVDTQPGSGGVTMFPTARDQVQKMLYFIKNLDNGTLHTMWKHNQY